MIKSKYKQLIILLILILLISVGITYAYFTANITADKAITITVKGGKMQMQLDGGNTINIANMIPDDNPIATKIFTITGSNTTEFDMGYSLYLVIDENTFSNYEIQYKLTSENTGNSGTVVIGNEELIGIKTGISNTLLGYGTFNSPTGGENTYL